MSTDEDAVIAELREQTAWLRLLGLQALRPLLTNVLRTKKQKLVYELSDGFRSSREVASLAQVSAGQVATLWKQWIALGICFEAGRTGRARHFGALRSLGLESAVPTSNGADEPEVTPE